MVVRSGKQLRDEFRLTIAFLQQGLRVGKDESKGSCPIVSATTEVAANTLAVAIQTVPVGFLVVLVWWENVSPSTCKSGILLVVNDLVGLQNPLLVLVFQVTTAFLPLE